MACNSVRNESSALGRIEQILKVLRYFLLERHNLAGALQHLAHQLNLRFVKLVHLFAESAYRRESKKQGFP